MTSCRIYVRSDQKINVILNFFKKYLFINSYLVPFNAAPVTNFKVVFLIDRTTLWQEFMMHHAIAIEENSEKNLYIWQNLMCFFRSWLFWTLPFRWLGFGFNIIPIHPWFITSHDFFEEICISSLNVANISWAMSMRHYFCSKFSNFGTILAAAAFMPETSVKIAWHELNDMPTSSYIHIHT